MYYHTSAWATLLFEHGESPEGTPWTIINHSSVELNFFMFFLYIENNFVSVPFHPAYIELSTLESLNKLEQILLIFSKVTQLESNFKA